MPIECRVCRGELAARPCEDVLRVGSGGGREKSGPWETGRIDHTDAAEPRELLSTLTLQPGRRLVLDRPTWNSVTPADSPR
ncbi:hypothetical protein PV367_07780 [Streptomyces europaeiscabiei]|uniref:Uncharacterized protein n=1 Tax=Streptomyces europaeiscabiei TaxID=146819 RepID=A0AAJ2PLR6_9ACTN|nr:hypothetical protein [Streptomyces europaeiscabiei]MDX3129700.1 hypothetical protein [Streptomyces europaeiscabiei]